MKVKELRELIENLSDDSDVCFRMNSGCCGDFEYMEVNSTFSSPKEDKRAVVNIDFDSLPGYMSCIQVSKTVADNKKYWLKYDPLVLKE